MKRLLILSDSHGLRGRVGTLLMKAEAEGPLDGVIHLGDGYRDLDLYRAELSFVYQVPGNCDGDSEGVCFYPEVEGLRVLMTHGHGLGVRTSLQELKRFARAHECAVALYGHTHRPHLERDGALMVLNPGAVMDGRYAILTLADGRAEAVLRGGD